MVRNRNRLPNFFSCCAICLCFLALDCCSSAPSDWTIHYFEGRPYYYNAKTGASSWEYPQGLNTKMREKQTMQDTSNAINEYYAPEKQFGSGESSKVGNNLSNSNSVNRNFESTGYYWETRDENHARLPYRNPQFEDNDNPDSIDTLVQKSEDEFQTSMLPKFSESLTGELDFPEKIKNISSFDTSYTNLNGEQREESTLQESEENILEQSLDVTADVPQSNETIYNVAQTILPANFEEISLLKDELIDSQKALANAISTSKTLKECLNSANAKLSALINSKDELEKMFELCERQATQSAAEVVRAENRLSKAEEELEASKAETARVVRKVKLIQLNVTLAEEISQAAEYRAEQLNSRLQEALKDIAMLDEALENHIKSSPIRSKSESNLNRTEKDEDIAQTFVLRKRKGWVTKLAGACISPFVPHVLKETSPEEILLEGLAKNMTEILYENRMLKLELEGKNNEIHDLQEKMEHEMLGRDSENEGLKSALMDMMEDLNEKEIQVERMKQELDAQKYSTDENQTRVQDALKECTSQLDSTRQELHLRTVQLELTDKELERAEIEVQTMQKCLEEAKKENNVILSKLNDFEMKCISNTAGNETDVVTDGNDQTVEIKEMEQNLDKQYWWHRFFLYM